MKERPILFSAPMVRALLDGSKTQTRRVCKPAASLSFVVEVPDPMERGQVYNCSHFGDEDGAVQFASPYGGIGDRLWVRETFAHIYRDNAVPAERRADDVVYKADGFTPDASVYGPWKPSIHMPRWASRIDLKVTCVRVERLQDISAADAIAEGLTPQVNDAGAWGLADGSHYHGNDPRLSYRSLWEAINGGGSWDANPFVWAVEFRRIKP